jgi:hypothetical protein
VQQLRQLKQVLQEQIHQLNEETLNVKALKQQVQQLEAYVALMQYQHGITVQQHRDQQDPVGAAAAAVLSSIAAGLSAAGQQPLQQQQQQYPQQRSSRLAFTPMPPAQKLMQQQQLPLSGGGIPQRESSLDRVTAALQHALSVAAGLPGASSTTSVQSIGGGAGTAGGSVSRRLTNGSFSSSCAPPLQMRSVSRALGMDLLSSQLGGPAGAGMAVGAPAGSSSDLDQDSLTPSQVRHVCAVLCCA